MFLVDLLQTAAAVCLLVKSLTLLVGCSFSGSQVQRLFTQSPLVIDLFINSHQLSTLVALWIQDLH
jgi:hypothetical protein